jgi:hypothetical protein
MGRWRLSLHKNWCIIVFMPRIFTSTNKDAELQNAFCNQFCLPYEQYLELVEQVQLFNKMSCLTDGVVLS